MSKYQTIDVICQNVYAIMWRKILIYFKMVYLSIFAKDNYIKYGKKVNDPVSSA